jgi:plastocyanin
MHAATLYLAPILGAEKSRVPFYVAGGALVAWALIVSAGLGLRRPEFPGDATGERIVIAISALLVASAAATAVVTSGSSARAQASAAPAPPSTSAAPSIPTGPSTSTAPSKSTVAPASTAPSTSTAPSAPTALKLAANPQGQLSYDVKQLSAKAGTVTITLTNTSPVPHDVTIAQASAVLGATPTFQGGSRALTLSLKPGSYTFYCSVPGHRQAGMEGTLTVS